MECPWCNPQCFKDRLGESVASSYSQRRVNYLHSFIQKNQVRNPGIFYSWPLEQKSVDIQSQPPKHWVKIYRYNIKHFHCPFLPINSRIPYVLICLHIKEQKQQECHTFLCFTFSSFSRTVKVKCHRTGKNSQLFLQLCGIRDGKMHFYLCLFIPLSLN